MIRSEQMKKMAVAFLFLLLTLIGLCTVQDYTGSYDEIVQQNQLKVNLKEYAVLFERMGIRCETALQMDVPPIREFVNRDYGMASMYLCAPFLSNMLSSQAFSSFLWGIVTWFWFVVGLWSLYSIVRLMGVSRFFSCLAVLMLFFCPRIFAHAHFNDKDLIFLCLMLLCLSQGGTFIQKLSYWSALKFSFAGALAFNLRAIGLLPWGVIALCAMLKLTLMRSWNRKMFFLAMWTIFSFCLCYFLITPAIWNDPVGFFEYLFSNSAEFSRWKGRMFFRGASFNVPENQLPFYYIPYMIVVTTPLYVLMLAIVGQTEALLLIGRKSQWKANCDKFVMLIAISLCWMLPLVAYVIIRPIVYNGWRHFYFSFAGLVVLAGYGAYCLWKKCSKQKWSRYSCAVFLGICIVVNAAGMIKNHPQQASYYNVLASHHQMETDYWNTCGTHALERLLACEERNEMLPLEVGCYFFDIQNARFKLNKEQKEILTTTTKKDSPYLYYNENYVQVYDIPKPEGYRILFEMESYGRLIGTMYERVY